MLDKNGLERSLTLLDKRLELANSQPVNIVVGGGSALIINELIKRPTTKDVDVLGLLDTDSQGNYVIKYCKPLPEFILTEVKKIASDFGLNPDWLNSGPADIGKFGFPGGMEKRLRLMKFGNILTVYFVSRLDMIHFKVYASVDTGPGRHVDDLLELKPTDKEIEMAVRWSLTQDPSNGFRETLKKMLEELNFGENAKRI